MEGHDATPKGIEGDDYGDVMTSGDTSHPEI
jgi:hypothetical protein